jgi:hypothetical protein
MNASERQEIIEAVARQIAAILDVATNSPRAEKIFRSMADVEQRIEDQNRDGWRFFDTDPVSLTERELNAARRRAMERLRERST